MTTSPAPVRSKGRPRDQAARTQEHLDAELHAARAATDRAMLVLFLVQWAVGVLLAALLSPLSWKGATSAVHPHVLFALGAGGLIAALPCYLASTSPGAAATRHVVAAGQVLFSGLLIHVSGGRTEMHFHVFLSLALLSFYRDGRVLLTAGGVAVADVLVRGLLVPRSIFGVESVAPWELLEHVVWIALAVALLARSCCREQAQLLEVAARRAELDAAHAEAEKGARTLSIEFQAARAELELQREAAQAASRAKSDFLANTSHEIRTPMNGVLGMLELTLEGDLPPAAREQLALARSSARALLGVIDDVLDISKIEAGRLEIVREPVDLRSALGEAVRAFAPVAQGKGVELVGRVAPEVPQRALEDPCRLRQIVNNLLGNAIKFTARGEVALEAQVAADAAGVPQLQVTVRDTGAGIPASRLEAIFEPFTQADGTTTRRFGGTGLGLTISRRLARMMGGDLTASSELGRGSVFTLRVPLLALEASAAPRKPLEPLRGRRALVVEDNATCRRLLLETVAGWGMEVEAADDGAPALALVRRAHAAGRPYDLVLLDLHMPGMSGLELLEALDREGRRHVGTSVVMVTVCDRPETTARARALGAAGHVVKPVEQDELLAAVLTALRGEASTPPAPAAAATSAAPVGGLRVLVAEDNPVNQRVVAGLLGRRGHQVELVGDGAAAVAAARRGCHDVLLLDVQMPVLDGWGAAQQIRAEEAAGRRAPLPIVALTAHARPEDAARAREVGMNAFATKPIDIGRLLAAIDEARAAVAAPPTLAPRGVEARPAPPTAPAAGDHAERAAAAPGLDHDETELLARCGGDDALAAELLETFLADLPRQRAALEAARAARDPRALRAAAHDLKGAAASVAAPALTAAAASLEAAAAAGAIDDGALGRLRSLIDAARAAPTDGCVGAALVGAGARGAALAALEGAS